MVWTKAGFNMLECENMKIGNVFVIKVFDYDKKHIKGKLYDVMKNRHFDYGNMAQLLMNIKELINSKNEINLSKETVFESASKEGNFEMVAGEKVWLPDKLRVMRTFKLKICFTKFNTWQGELWCVDTEEHNAFRSVLELVMLMDEALEEIEPSYKKVSGGML